MMKLMKRLALCLALVLALALAMALCGTALAEEAPYILTVLDRTACDMRGSKGGDALETDVLENGSLTRFAP